MSVPRSILAPLHELASDALRRAFELGAKIPYLHGAQERQVALALLGRAQPDLTLLKPRGPEGLFRPQEP